MKANVVQNSDKKDTLEISRELFEYFDGVMTVVEVFLLCCEWKSVDVVLLLVLALKSASMTVLVVIIMVAYSAEGDMFTFHMDSFC